MLISYQYSWTYEDWWSGMKGLGWELGIGGGVECADFLPLQLDIWRLVVRDEGVRVGVGYWGRDGGVRVGVGYWGRG